MKKKKIKNSVLDKLKMSLCLVMFIVLCTGCSSNRELSELSLNVEGTKFSVNSKLESLSKEDWILNINEEDVIEPGNEMNLFVTSTKKKEIEVMLVLKNNTEETMLVKDAPIQNIAIYDIEKNLPNIKLANGITAKSTYKDVMKKYGQPMSQHVNQYQDVLSYTTTYYSNYSIMNAEQMTFEFKDEKLYRIWLQGAEEIEENHKINFDLKDVIGYEPILKNYTPSINYSDELLDATVLVGNVEIKKGTPIKRLIDDGWKVISSYNYPEECELTLTKDKGNIAVRCMGQYKLGETLDTEMKINEVSIDLSKNEDIIFELPASLSILDKGDAIVEKIGGPQSIRYSDRGVRIGYIKADNEGNMVNTTYLEFDSTQKMTDFSIRF